MKSKIVIGGHTHKSKSKIVAAKQGALGKARSKTAESVDVDRHSESSVVPPLSLSRAGMDEPPPSSGEGAASSER